MKRYTILLTADPEGGGYIADVPALPGCHTQGDTLDEAIANAREAIAVWIQSARKHGEEVPEEQEAPRLVTVEVAA
ncbi:MAG: type II toxin-antitoxin system HicB family antitoxin [Chloroflexota bacterium]